MPRLERLILMPKQKWDGHWFKLWGQTVTTRWDLVVDLRGSGTALFLLARQRQHSEGRAPPWLAPRPVRRQHGPRPAAAARLPGPGRRSAPARRPCCRPGCRYIGLGPTANWAGKVWPAERFVALFQRLRQGPLPRPAPVIFSGPGDMEAALARPVLAALPEAIDLAGRLTLPEAAACLARLRAVHRQ